MQPFLLFHKLAWRWWSCRILRVSGSDWWTMIQCYAEECAGYYRRQYLIPFSGKVGRSNGMQFVEVKPANPIHTPQRLELMSCQAREQTRLE